MRLLWKNIETPRCHCKHCRDFFTNGRQGRNVSKAKTVVGEILMLKTADFNLEGYKSFSNYFSSGKFCQYAYDDKSPMCCYAKWKCYPFIVPHDFAHDLIRRSLCFVLLISKQKRTSLCAFRKCCLVCQMPRNKK